MLKLYYIKELRNIKIIVADIELFELQGDALILILLLVLQKETDLNQPH